MVDCVPLREIPLGDPQWGRGLAPLLTDADFWVLLSPVEGADSVVDLPFSTAIPSPGGSLITLVHLVAGFMPTLNPLAGQCAA